jgi:hypothetical protein
MGLHRPSTAPRYVRPDGVISYLLASPRTDAAEYLATALVELRPGGREQVHSHLLRYRTSMLHRNDLVMSQSKLAKYVWLRAIWSAARSQTAWASMP